MRLLDCSLAFALLFVALPAAADEPAPAGGASPETRAQPDRPKLTLAQILELSHQRSPLIKQAAANIDVRKSQQYEAESNWFPTGTISAGLAPAPAVACSGGPDNCLTTKDPRSDITYAGNTLDAIRAIAGIGGEFTLYLTQPLYTFGKIEHGRAAAIAGIEAEQARTDAARDENDLQVTRAYWGLKAARAARATASDVRDTLRKWVDKIEADLDADKPKYNYTQSDLSRLKVALAQVEILIADAENRALYAARGLQIATQQLIDIDDEELDVVEIIEQPLDYYQHEMLLNRPEVRALAAGRRAYDQLAKLSFSQMLPDIGANMSFTWRGTNTEIQEPNNAFMNHINALGFGASIGLRVGIDVPQKRARWLHARADADAFEAQRQAALAFFELEVTQAWSALQEARRRMKLLDRAQHQAQGWVTSMEQQLDLNMTDTAGATRDFVDAARNYFDLRLRYYAAIFDVNQQIAQLRRATGVEVAR